MQRPRQVVRGHVHRPLDAPVQRPLVVPAAVHQEHALRLPRARDEPHQQRQRVAVHPRPGIARVVQRPERLQGVLEVPHPRVPQRRGVRRAPPHLPLARGDEHQQGLPPWRPRRQARRPLAVLQGEGPVQEVLRDVRDVRRLPERRRQRLPPRLVRVPDVHHEVRHRGQVHQQPQDGPAERRGALREPLGGGAPADGLGQPGVQHRRLGQPLLHPGQVPHQRRPAERPDAPRQQRQRHRARQAAPVHPRDGRRHRVCVAVVPVTGGCAKCPARHGSAGRRGGKRGAARPELAGPLPTPAGRPREVGGGGGGGVVGCG